MLQLMCWAKRNEHDMLIRLQPEFVLFPHKLAWNEEVLIDQIRGSLDSDTSYNPHQCSIASASNFFAANFPNYT